MPQADIAQHAEAFRLTETVTERYRVGRRILDCRSRFFSNTQLWKLDDRLRTAAFSGKAFQRARAGLIDLRSLQRALHSRIHQVLGKVLRRPVQRLDLRIDRMMIAAVVDGL